MRKLLNLHFFTVWSENGRETAKGAEGVIGVEGQRYHLTLQLAGRHNLHNALLAVAVGIEGCIHTFYRYNAYCRYTPDAQASTERAAEEAERVAFELEKAWEAENAAGVAPPPAYRY